MRRPLATGAAVLGAVAILGLSGCGSSNTNGSSNGGGGGSGGGDFCSQAQNAVNQFTKIGQDFQNQNAQQTPSVDSFKQLFSAAAQTFDQLDSSAPSAIATDFHTLRQAIDQANTSAQSATSLEQLSSAFQPLSTQPVQTASDHVTTYMQNTCHITPAPSSS